MKWLLVRGLTREQRHWGEFLTKFQTAFGAENVFCLDHVGVGSEAGRAPVRSISAMANDLRARWLELRASELESWGIVSLSLGSMVSLDWCQRHPEDFKLQVLMNVSSATDSLPWQRLLLENLKTFAEMARLQDSVQRERAVLDMCTNLLSSSQKSQLAEQWSHFALPARQLRRVAAAQLWSAIRFRRPRRLTVPSLMLVSAADRLVDPACSMSIAAALKIPMEMHPTAGHELALDDPEWVIERIREHGDY